MSPIRPEIPEDVARHPRKCRVCGCTDDKACEPYGCWWVEDDLCSSCSLVIGAPSKKRGPEKKR